MVSGLEGTDGSTLPTGANFQPAVGDANDRSQCYRRQSNGVCTLSASVHSIPPNAADNMVCSVILPNS